MSAANALLKAIHQRLSVDAGLIALLGLDGIHDRLLAQPKLPVIVIGEMETRDLSTATEAGEEHVLALGIWSDDEGRRRTLEIADKVTALLDNASLVLEGATLVSLMRTGMRSRREAKTKYYLCEIRFRAVTE